MQRQHYHHAHSRLATLTMQLSCKEHNTMQRHHYHHAHSRLATLTMQLSCKKHNTMQRQHYHHARLQERKERQRLSEGPSHEKDTLKFSVLLFKTKCPTQQKLETKRMKAKKTTFVFGRAWFFFMKAKWVALWYPPSFGVSIFLLKTREVLFCFSWSVQLSPTINGDGVRLW